MPSFSDILEKHSIPTPFLYGISDRSQFPKLPASEYVRLLLAGAAPVIQLREKDLSSDALDTLVREAAKAKKSHQLLIVNSALDSALRHGVDGCHLTSQQDLGPAVERRRRGGCERSFLLGKSAHTLQAALRAEREGADYVMLGPVFDPLSKRPSRPPLGLSALREASQMLLIPVVAVGGVTPENVTAVWGTGALGAAGITWLKNELAGMA